jgi:hypothetical protein
LPALYDALHRALEVIPGVQAVTFSAMPLLANADWSETVQADAGRGAEEVQFQPIRWNFFETLGLRIVAGRTLTSNDHDQSAPVGVINESMARHVFGEPRPIGRWLTFLSGPLMRRRVEIVGVVSDAKSSTVTGDPSATLYVPWAQIPPVPVTFEARTSVDPATLMPTVRASVQKTAPGVAIVTLKTQDQQIAELTARPRALAAATGVFSVVGLLLACLGIYGAVAQDALERTREVGIRIALGARPIDVLRLLMRDVLVVLAIAALVGAVCSAAAATAISRLLFGVSTADPGTLAASTLVLLIAAMLAALGPAVRASRVPPTRAIQK